MKAMVLAALWTVTSFSALGDPPAFTEEKLVRIELATAEMRWNTLITGNGEIRSLPKTVRINKIRFQREETRYFHSIKDVGPGWNSFRLIPSLPEHPALRVRTRGESLLRFGFPMLQIEKENYAEWRFISVTSDNKGKVMYLAMSFNDLNEIIECRVGDGVFPEISNLEGKEDGSLDD